MLHVKVKMITLYKKHKCIYILNKNPSSIFLLLFKIFLVVHCSDVAAFNLKNDHEMCLTLCWLCFHLVITVLNLTPHATYTCINPCRPWPTPSYIFDTPPPPQYDLCIGSVHDHHTYTPSLPFLVQSFVPVLPCSIYLSRSVHDLHTSPSLPLFHPYSYSLTLSYLSIQ